VKISNWIVATLIGLAVTVSVLTDTWFYLLIATAAVVFVLFTLAYPKTAMFLWLLIAPLGNAYLQVKIPQLPDITFNRVIVTLVTIALLMRVMFKGARLAPFGIVELVMLVLVAIMSADLIRSGNPISDGLQDYDERIRPILLFLAARNMFGSVRDLRRVMATVVLLGCYLALHGGYQYFTSGKIATNAAVEDPIQRVGDDRVNESHLAQGRAVGPFVNGTEYGGVAAIAFLCALFIYLYQTRRLSRATPLAAMPFIGAAVVMSSTRSVWLGAYLALLLMVWLDRRRRAALVAVVIGITIVAGAAAYVFLPKDSTLEERASSLEPIRARLIMYNIGLRIAVRKPLTGYGRGAPSRIAARRELYSMGTPDAELAAGQFHNIFMMTLVEWGVFALAAYVAMLVLILRAAIELRRRTAHEAGLVHHFAGLFLAASVVFVVQGLFVDLTAFLYLNGLFFFLAGLTFAHLDATPALALAREPFSDDRVYRTPEHLPLLNA
jgi:O-antigen ligase